MPKRIIELLFQSTRSARSATGDECHGRKRHAISIHALRKERDQGLKEAAREKRISIHALRKERDL